MFATLSASVLEYQGNVSFWANTCFKRETRSVALIYAGGCICVLVMLLTKPLLPCTHRLQPKHFPKLQQRPGTVASILLLHLRARQPRSSVLSISVDQQVREHTQEPFSAAANVVFRRFYTTFKWPTGGRPVLLNHEYFRVFLCFLFFFFSWYLPI